MSGGGRPVLDRDIPPAELWDAKVREGMSPDSATAYVARIHGPPPAPFVAAPQAAPRPTLGTAAPDATSARARPIARPHSFGEDVTGAAGALAQGMTGGLADEIMAGAAGIVSNPLHPFRNFEKLRQQAAEPERQFAANHPLTDAVSQIGGAVGEGVLGGAAAEAVLGPRAAATATGKAPLLQRTLQGAKDIGAASAIGGAVGAASGEGTLSDRFKAGLHGAELTAGLATGMKAGGALLRASGVPALVRNVTPRPATENSATARVLNATGVPLASHERLAAQDILADFERSGLSVDDYIARAQENPNHPLYDLGPSLPQPTGTQLLRRDSSGDPLVRRARGAQSIPSRGSAEISEFTNARAAERPAAVKDALESGLGHGRENTAVVAEDLVKQRAKDFSPLYEQAFEHGAVDDERINSLIKLPIAADAWRQANRLAQAEGRQLPQAFEVVRTPTKIIGRDGKPLMQESLVAKSVPDVRTLHYMKLGLDDVIESNRGRPLEQGGISSTMEAAAQKQKSALVDVLDEVPNYKQARQGYAGASEAMRAYDRGSKFFAEKGDDLEHQWSKWSDTDKELYRRRAVATIEDELARTNNPGRLLNELTARKLRTIFPDPAEYDAFELKLRRQVQGATNDAKIMGGSPTARIQADQADLGAGGDQAASVMQSIASPRAAASRLLNNAVTNRARGFTENRVNALAPYLTARGSDLNQKLLFLKALQQEMEAGAQQSRLRRARVTGQLGGQTGGSTSSTRP